MKYESRTYRDIIDPQGLVRFGVIVEETDLAVYAQKTLTDFARELVLESRGMIERYIRRYPKFAKTLFPWTIDGPAPQIIRQMAQAGMVAGVGPMAAVAGAVAEFVGHGLLQRSEEVIVENGGDLFIRCNRPITVGLYAGDSSLSNKMGIQVQASPNPVGLCTSSGRVGHSLSLGRADAVCIMANGCAFADAVATATANHVQTRKNLRPAVNFAKNIPGVKGVLIICDDEMALWGGVKIVPV